MTALISKLKIMMHTHNPKAMSLPTTNVLHFTILDIMSKQNFKEVTMARLKVKSPTSVSTKYQLPTPYSFPDIGQKIHYRSTSLKQGQRSNQGHTMMCHALNSLPMSLPHMNFLEFMVYRSRSLQQGQRSNQGHIMTLHTYTS